MAKNEQKIIQDTIKEFFSVLQIEGENTTEIKEDSIDIQLQTEDSGIIIGYHGEILEALQLVLALLVSKKVGKFLRVSIEVGDYKKNRSDWLEQLAMQAKEKALTQDQAVPLTNLKAWERRIVHMFFQNDKEVTTESEGEGRERVLVVKPQKE